jgi:hypothetical protein
MNSRTLGLALVVTGIVCACNTTKKECDKLIPVVHHHIDPTPRCSVPGPRTSDEAEVSAGLLQEVVIDEDAAAAAVAAVDVSKSVFVAARDRAAKALRDESASATRQLAALRNFKPDGISNAWAGAPQDCLDADRDLKAAEESIEHACGY